MLPRDFDITGIIYSHKPPHDYRPLLTTAALLGGIIIILSVLILPAIFLKSRIWQT